MGTKKNYSALFKAEVAIEAIRNQIGSAEICSKHKIPATNLYEWRDRAISQLHQVFVLESEYVRKQRLMHQEVENLHKIIGELTIENNFLKKKLQR